MVLQGTGAVLDDEFNFLIGEWHRNRLQGHAFLRFSSGMMLCGQFRDNVPTGTVAIHHGRYKMFMHRNEGRIEEHAWKREAVLIDSNTNTFYMLELRPKEQDREIDPDSTQKISLTSTSREQGQGRPQWKIKIVDRCPMKKDGALAGYSKLIKNLEQRNNVDYDRKDYSIEEQNHISLIATILGTQFKSAYLINPVIFLATLSQINPKITVKEGC
jgi:hypothetical protein